MKNLEKPYSLYDSNKGYLYHGPEGNGKTTTMKNTVNGRVGFYSSNDIVCIAQESGPAGLRYHVRNKWNEIIIDDIGHEPTTTKHYGTEIQPIVFFITECYVIGKKLHITTNLTFDELKDKYGTYVVDRLKEMCEWISFDGPSFRK